MLELRERLVFQKERDSDCAPMGNVIKLRFENWLLIFDIKIRDRICN